MARVVYLAIAVNVERLKGATANKKHRALLEAGVPRVRITWRLHPSGFPLILSDATARFGRRWIVSRDGRWAMGGSTILIVVFTAIAAALLGLWAYRRPAKPTSHEHGRSRAKNQSSAEQGKSRARNQVEQWGVRIAAPVKERACPQVRGLVGKEFPIDEKPPLPLPNCPYSHQCECHYVKLFDRRSHERRSDQDRRQAQRFEDAGPPRRSGKDRRKDRRNSQIDWT